MAYVQIIASRVAAGKPIKQDFGDDVRLDLDDLNQRIIEAETVNEASINDDFTTDTLSTAIWDLDGDGANVPTILAATHQAEYDLGGGGSEYNVMAAASGRARVDLSLDQVFIVECRLRRPSGTGGAGFVFGIQDSGLALSTIACLTNQSDMIGFIRGAGTDFRFRMAKGGTAQESTDFGNINNWTKLRMEITRSGATKSVKVLADGAEISGSPFTSATAFPDTVVQRPLGGAGDLTAAGFSLIWRCDYFYANWRGRPLSA